MDISNTKKSSEGGIQNWRFWVFLPLKRHNFQKYPNFCVQIHYIQYGGLYTLNKHICETKSMCPQTVQNFGIFPHTIRKNTILFLKVFFSRRNESKKENEKIWRGTKWVFLVNASSDRKGKFREGGKGVEGGDGGGSQRVWTAWSITFV